MSFTCCGQFRLEKLLRHERFPVSYFTFHALNFRKQQGNVHYKARDFAKAIIVYGAAIDLATSINCPDASIYLNRASAYMMKLMVCYGSVSSTLA